MAIPGARDYPHISKELKYYHNGATRDINPCNPIWTDYNDVTDSTRNTIFCPIMGVGNGDRLGKIAAVLHIGLRGWIYFNSTDADNFILQPNMVRVMIVRDSATNGDPIDMDNLMLHSKSLNGSIQSFQSGAYRHHFEVLYDRIFQVVPNGYNGNVASTMYEGSIIPFNFEIDYPNGVLVNFTSANLETVQPIIDNGWFIVAGSYDNPRKTNGGISSKVFPKISWDSVTTFVDV